MQTKTLRIQNYKSIKDLKFSPKRVNVFIGEPNSGKTNIMEALSLLSVNICTNTNLFREVIRFINVVDLFPNGDTSKTISINTDSLKFTLGYHKNQNGALMNNFLGQYFPEVNHLNTKAPYQFSVDFSGNITFHHSSPNFNNNICYYLFKKPRKFSQTFRSFLEPPYGDNIPSLLLADKKLKKMVSDILKGKDYRLNIKPVENEIEFAREDEDGNLYSYPYYLLSETLHRIIFMFLAIESNKNMMLVFDEPESNTFPFYTKNMAEKIALDKTNQYFLTTHNPYLLNGIIEKTPAKELNIIHTRMENFETKTHILTAKQLEKIDDSYDVFFNIDSFV